MDYICLVACLFIVIGCFVAGFFFASFIILMPLSLPTHLCLPHVNEFCLGITGGYFLVSNFAELRCTYFESTLSCLVLAQPIFFLQEALYHLASKINVGFGFTCT